MEKTHIEQDRNEGKKLFQYGHIMKFTCPIYVILTNVSPKVHNCTHTQRARIMDRFQCHANA